MKRIYARNDNVIYRMIFIYGNPRVHVTYATKHDGIIIDYLRIDRNYRGWKYK